MNPAFTQGVNQVKITDFSLSVAGIRGFSKDSTLEFKKNLALFSLIYGIEQFVLLEFNPNVQLQSSSFIKAAESWTVQNNNKSHQKRGTDERSEKIERYVEKIEIDHQFLKSASDFHQLLNSLLSSEQTANKQQIILVPDTRLLSNSYFKELIEGMGASGLAYFPLTDDNDKLVACVLMLSYDNGISVDKKLIKSRILEQVIFTFKTYLHCKQEDNSALTDADQKGIQRFMDNFLAMLNYEIRTPLHSIYIISGLLEQFNEKFIKEYREYYHLIENEGDKLVKSLDKLVKYAQLRSGMITPKFALHSCNLLLSQVFTEWQDKFISQNVRFIKSDLERNEDIEIWTDMELVKIILGQFIDNSLKYTSKGYVEIGALKVNSHIVLFVADTGVGIEEGALSKVFSPYSKFSWTDDADLERMGLGLSIAKALSVLLNGSIIMESRLFTGTIFKLIMPVPETLNKNTTVHIANQDESEFTHNNKNYKFSKSVEPYKSFDL